MKAITREWLKYAEIDVETRYPGEFGMLPDGKPTLEEAKQLFSFAEYIFQQTKKALKRKS